MAGKKKANVYLVGGYADCLDCKWDSYGKNAMGTAAQHAIRTGHNAHATMDYAARPLKQPEPAP